jgi:hypothetical protein
MRLRLAQSEGAEAEGDYAITNGMRYSGEFTRDRAVVNACRCDDTPVTTRQRHASRGSHTKWRGQGTRRNGDPGHEGSRDRKRVLVCRVQV